MSQNFFLIDAFYHRDPTSVQQACSALVPDEPLMKVTCNFSRIQYGQLTFQEEIKWSLIILVSIKLALGFELILLDEIFTKPRLSCTLNVNELDIKSYPELIGFECLWEKFS